jgi:hypothetical protein
VTIEPAVRLRPEQKPEIRRVMQLRTAATKLRLRVSEGQYGDEELQRFWKIVEDAGAVLQFSNPQLGMRAGLGESFFSSVVRDRRRPKLSNFLKALTAIINAADENLFDLEGGHATPDLRNNILSGGKTTRELLLLATSLGRMAYGEIKKLDDERPNDPATISKNEKQRDLLLIFAQGFDQIAAALAALTDRPTSPALLTRVNSVVSRIGNQVNDWWGKNGAEAIDWGVRIPVFTASIATLGWAGADMTVATAAIAAIVGGDKVVEALKAAKKSK